MPTTRAILPALAAALVIAGVGAASAQDQASGAYGAVAGRSYVPSPNDVGCGGLLCHPVAPADAARPRPPVATTCGGGVLCDAFPNAMGESFNRPPPPPPAPVAVEAPAPEPVAPAHRRHRRKAIHAARTPAPAPVSAPVAQ